MRQFNIGSIGSALVLALALGGCGSSSNDAVETTDTPATTDTTGTTSTTDTANKSGVRLNYKSGVRLN